MNVFQNNKSLFLLFTIIYLSIFLSKAQSETLNGFDLSNSSINPAQILPGGPPKDGIPAIDHPKFLPIKKVKFLKDNDIVIGLVRGSIARAYPTRILVWHEIVNDTIGNDAVVVTYCPLCGTAMVFDRKIDEKVRSFGVSGLLYQSDVLLYDRESESLWSQLAMTAISGKERGARLTWLPSEHLTYKAWREKYPHGQVLSTDTGYRRNYSGEAYSDYFASEYPMFPVSRNRDELKDKEWVIGVVVDGLAKAYPVSIFPVNSKITDRIGKRELIVTYDKEKKHPFVSDTKGQPIPSVMVFWFAWQAFYPNTELWSQ